MAVAERIWVKEERLIKLNSAFCEIRFDDGATRAVMYNRFMKFNTHFQNTFMYKYEWIWNAWGKTPNPLYQVIVQLYMGKFKMLFLKKFCILTFFHIFKIFQIC